MQWFHSFLASIAVNAICRNISVLAALSDVGRGFKCRDLGFDERVLYEY